MVESRLEFLSNCRSISLGIWQGLVPDLPVGAGSSKWKALGGWQVGRLPCRYLALIECEYLLTWCSLTTNYILWSALKITAICLLCRDRYRCRGHNMSVAYSLCGAETLFATVSRMYRTPLDTGF